MPTRFLLPVLLLAGCAGIVPGTTSVEVDGERVAVRPIAGGYQAIPEDDVTMFVIGPDHFARNVRAIEAFAGCPADPDSIRHQHGYTTAAVRC